MNKLFSVVHAILSFAIGTRRTPPAARIASAVSPGGVADQLPGTPRPTPAARRPIRSNREYDVFVSYRRDKGSEIARVLAEKLQSRGYRVFLDVDSLGSGEWGEELKRRIEECPDFIAVVTDGYFVRCENPADVVRKEIAQALESKATVVPLLIGQGGIPAALPADIQGVSAHNGVRYLHEYADQAIDKVCGFLRSTPLLGPERLGTGEAQPRIVLLCVLFTIGVWRGAMIGDEIGYGGGWWVYALFGIGLGLLAVLVGLIPTLVGLTLYGNVRNIRRDALYAGPWAPFWALLIPLMFLATSLLVAIAQGMIGIRSFFLGGVLGGTLALLLTRAIIETDLWGLATRALGLRNH